MDDFGPSSYGTQFTRFVKLKFANKKDLEFLTLGGITFFFLIASFSQFKLPHYLNSIIPLFSILTASYLFMLNKEKLKRVLLGFQYFVLSIIFVATVLICFLVFEFETYYALAFLLIFFTVIIYYCLKREVYLKKIITLTVFGSILLNATLNLHFYPNLLTYQAGSSMAKVVAKNQIPVERIYKIGDYHTWSFDFYNRKPLKITSFESLQEKHDVWVYANDEQLRQLQNLDFDWDVQYSEAQFRITRLSLRFLNPGKRKKSLNKMHLVHIY